MPKIFSEEDRDILYEKMLDVGLQLLEKKQYKHISIEEVAREVGVAKGTFYSFFKSKELFFYEVMQRIKERNREPLRALPENASVKEISECLFYRYMHVKTVYDYFLPEEIKQIVRRLPDGDNQNDSEQFAREKCGHIKGCKGKPEVIVSMFNILGIASANRQIMEPAGYEGALKQYCRALAEYIVNGE